MVSKKTRQKENGGLGEERTCLILGGFGSMRQIKKEWKRTQASGLFKEKHGNSESGIINSLMMERGMNLLWETYEKNENTTSVPESDQCKKATKVSMKLGRCCRGRMKKKMKRR